MAAPTKSGTSKSLRAEAERGARAVAAGKASPAPDSGAPVPFLLDFYPLEDDRSTQLSRFYEELKGGRLTTTRCRKDGVLWPPRIVCPRCHAQELDWVELPGKGRLYAFSAVLAGAPKGMEAEMPFVVGLVDLDGSPLRLFGRIEGSRWTNCRVGQPVAVETYSLPDGRWFYRFRTTGR